MNRTNRMEFDPHGNSTSNPEDCPLWNNCSSNLCPLDPDIRSRVWLPEDEVCRNKEFQTLQFVITQRKIKRVVRKNTGDREDYFTYDMLNRNIVVKKGITGIPDPPDTIRDPARWYREHERKWIEEHPEIPEEKMKEFRMRGKNLAKSKQKMLPDNAFSEIDNQKGIMNYSEPLASKNGKDGDIFHTGEAKKEERTTATAGGGLK